MVRPNHVTPIGVQLLPSRMLESNSLSEPLHLIIGEGTAESADGYRIQPLDEGFLFGAQSYAHTVNEIRKPETHESPRRPQRFPDSFKRRSAEIPTFYVPTTLSPFSAHNVDVTATGWSEAGAVSTGSAFGHRRSSSYGNNSPQIWPSITQQQSMPCISKLTGQDPNRQCGE